MIVVTWLRQVIRVFQHIDGWPDIGWRVQAKCRFTETPVSDCLEIGQQRLHQGHAACHLPLMNSILRRTALVVVIERYQLRCRRVDLLPPLLLDQVPGKLRRGLRQRDIEDAFERVTYSRRAQRIRGGYFVV
ncbi:hypothetical protein D3C86_1820140 [compost metagenome]